MMKSPIHGWILCRCGEKEKIYCSVHAARPVLPGWFRKLHQPRHTRARTGRRLIRRNAKRFGRRGREGIRFADRFNERGFRRGIHFVDLFKRREHVFEKGIQHLCKSNCVPWIILCAVHIHLFRLSRCKAPGSIFRLAGDEKSPPYFSRGGSKNCLTSAVFAFVFRRRQREADIVKSPGAALASITRKPAPLLRCWRRGHSGDTPEPPAAPKS